MACLSSGMGRLNAATRSQRCCHRARFNTRVAACTQPVAAAAPRSSIVALKPALRVSSNTASSSQCTPANARHVRTAAGVSVPGMPSRLAPEFGPAVQQLLSKAMSVPSALEGDTGHQEKCLLLLLVDEEPDAKQLLLQQLSAAEKAKVVAAGQLSSHTMPGAAFASITTTLALPTQWQTLYTQALAPEDASTGSQLQDKADADLPEGACPQPSAGLCKALNAALLVARQHGLTDVNWAALLWGLLSASLAEEQGLPFCPADVREELGRIVYKQAAVQELIATAAVKTDLYAGSPAASSCWWERNDKADTVGSSSNSSSSWMDNSLTQALSIAGNKLRDEPVDAAEPTSHMVCSSIIAAAASGHRPSDKWLQQAWQLLERALSVESSRYGMTSELSEAAVGAAYASAITLGFAGIDVFDVLLSDTVVPPRFEEEIIGFDKNGEMIGYAYGDCWLRWLRMHATPGVLDFGVPSAYLKLVPLSKFAKSADFEDSADPAYHWNAEAAFALAWGLQRAKPQLQAEALVVLSTEDMVAEMFGEEDSTKLPSYVCAELLGALAEGLSRTMNGSSSNSNSSAEGGSVLSEVSQDVLLQLAAAMPVLLRDLVEAIEEYNYAADDTPAATGKLKDDKVLAAAGKAAVLAQRLAAYICSIRPGNASTAQLVQLNAALDAVSPAASALAAAVHDHDSNLEAAITNAEWPQESDRQVFYLLAERLDMQEQPTAALVTAVAAGVAARCSSAAAATRDTAEAAAAALQKANLPDMSVHELAGFLNAVVVIAENSPAIADSYSFGSLISHWRKQLPAYVMPVVVTTLEALPEYPSAAIGNTGADGASADSSQWSVLSPRITALEEAEPFAEAAASVLVSIEQLGLPVPSITMELLQRLLPRLFMLIEPGRVGDVLRFVAQQQQRKFKT